MTKIEGANTILNNNAVGAMVDELAQKLLHEVVIKAVIKEIVTAIPFFSIPVINPALVFVVTKITEKVYERAKLAGGLFVIDLREQSRLTQYNTAVKEFKEVLLEKPENIEKAKEEYLKRLSSLIRFNI